VRRRYHRRGHRGGRRRHRVGIIKALVEEGWW
jgi:hypothetical protein